MFSVQKNRRAFLPTFAALVTLVWSKFTLVVLSLAAGCATLPSRYVEQAEPGVTLTDLVSRPEYYQNKVVILGGAIVEEKREGERIWLKLRNRPLDADYMPHEPASTLESEAGFYWVAVGSQGLPQTYRNWARATVVGRVVGIRQSKEPSGNQVEPVLAALYLRGWGESGLHDATWEESTDPNYLLSAPEGIQGELGIR